MKRLAPFLAVTLLAGCQMDPATLLRPKGEATSLAPTSAPQYQRVGPLPESMEGVEEALKTPGTGCFATGTKDGRSADGGTVSLAPQEPLDVVAIDESGYTVTANRRALNMTIYLPRSGVELGRLAYAKPQ